MKLKNILMLAAGAAALVALPAAMAQSSAPPADQLGATSQKASDDKAQSEADRKAQRRAAAAADKAKAEKSGKLDKRAEEEEEQPLR
ncbi:hypothetical protein HF319_12155 [Xanthomonas sp. Kuri4-1]